MGSSYWMNTTVVVNILWRSEGGTAASSNNDSNKEQQQQTHKQRHGHDKIRRPNQIRIQRQTYVRVRSLPLRRQFGHQAFRWWRPLRGAS